MNTTEDVFTPPPPAAPGDDPVAALRSRYAAGDLSLDQLEAEIRGIPDLEGLADHLANTEDDRGLPDELPAAPADVRRESPPFARLVWAIGVFCDAYLAGPPGRD